MAYVGLGASLRTGSYILGSMGLGWFSIDSCVPGVTLEGASFCHKNVGATVLALGLVALLSCSATDKDMPLQQHNHVFCFER